MAKTLDETKLIKTQLSQLFPIKDLDEISEYLGVEVKRDRENKTFRLRQLGSIGEVIKRAIKPTRIQSIPRHHIDTKAPATPEEHAWYRSVTGQLSHIARYKVHNSRHYISS